MAADKKNSKLLKNFAHVESNLAGIDLVVGRHDVVCLIGSSGSGKSTIFKQLNYVYGDGVSDEGRARYAPIVYNNVYLAMKTLIKCSNRFEKEEPHMGIQTPEAKECIERVMDERVDGCIERGMDERVDG